ncbi:MAG: HDOD domain-containing protein [Pseudomonadota bacterium]
MGTAALQVLLVDDEPAVVSALRRMLQLERPGWRIRCTTSGQEASALLDVETFDAVVSDIKMPGLDGIQLLERLRVIQPQAIRIALSGHTDRHELLRSVPTVHRFLPKPCDSHTLCDTIERACALTRELEDPALRSLVGRLGGLPTLSGPLQEMLAALDQPDAPTRFCRLLDRAPGITAKLLQLVNSPWFGARATTRDPRHAVVLLGTETVRALLLQAHVFDYAQGRLPLGFDLAAQGRHAEAVAGAARLLARRARATAIEVELAFTAGVLHDLGKLPLAVGLPAEYQQVMAANTGSLAWREERAVFHGTHAAVGACLLGVWGLPGDLVEAVAWHHGQPASSAQGIGLVTGLVEYADRLHHRRLAGDSTPVPPDEIPATLRTRLDPLEAHEAIAALFRKAE